MSSDQHNLYDSFESAGIEGVNPRAVEQKLKCPQCADQRKNNRSDKPLSVNPQKGTWNCHHCGWKGGVKKKDYSPMQEKTYTLPKDIELPLGESVVKWFESRGISKTTLQRFKIGENSQEGFNWINFPYYRDGVLINVKKRNAKKDFRLSSGAELIFYNLDSIKDSDEVVIVEGEMDCLAMYEAGVFNCISVPNGASKGSMKLEYLDNCWAKFEGKKKVILFGDNDEPGLALREELARRIGRDRCWIVAYPDDQERAGKKLKDANDILKQYGASFLKSVVRAAEPYPIDDVSKPKDYTEDVLNYWRNGFPSGDKVGWKKFDPLMSFRPGDLTFITGIPNSGKSAFLDQLAIRLSARHNWRFGVVSREQWPHSVHVSKLVQLFSGKGLRDKAMNETIIKRSISFLDEHFFLFGIADMTIDGILTKAKQLVLQYGIKGLIIDPWTTLEHDKKSFSSELEYTNHILKEICLFKDMYSVHVFIVAHPKKIQTEGTGDSRRFAVPSLYDISGSSDFYNFMDNGIVVYRNVGTKKDKSGSLGDSILIAVKKVRHFFVGTTGDVTMDYDMQSGCYSEEWVPFENEYNLWMERMNEQAAEPIPISFEEPPPQREPGQFTDFNKMNISNNFEIPENVSEPPF